MTEPDVIPLYAFAEGDSLGILLLPEATSSLEEVLDQMRMAVRTRMNSSVLTQIWHGSRLLDLRATVAGSGLEPLERIDVRRGQAGY